MLVCQHTERKSSFCWCENPINRGSVYTLITAKCPWHPTRTQTRCLGNICTVRPVESFLFQELYLTAYCFIPGNPGKSSASQNKVEFMEQFKVFSKKCSHCRYIAALQCLSCYLANGENEPGAWINLVNHVLVKLNANTLSSCQKQAPKSLNKVKELRLHNMHCNKWWLLSMLL